MKPCADKDFGPRCVMRPHEIAGEISVGNYRNCPYGRPGDLLWVREAWTTHKCFDGIAGRDLITTSIGYPADGKIETGRYRHARFMPRRFSRLTLRLTDVRAQRLKRICGDDCIAEGAWRIEDKALGRSHEAIEAFQVLWEDINGRGSWHDDPLVWALSFDVIPTNIDAVPEVPHA